jgi:hypothetical protein
METIESLHERASKYSSKSVFILPLLFAATWAASPVVTAATTIENFHLKGNTVTAIFEAFDPQDPCLLNFVSVFASDQIDKVSPGGKKSTANVGTILTILQRDVCTDTPLFEGVSLPASHSFQVAGDLRSATLSAEVPVLNTVTSLVTTFQANLTFQATTASEFLHAKETFSDPELGIKLMSQSVSWIAQATATGTVVGDGQNFTPEPSDSATIQKQNDGTLLIQKTF